MAEKHEGFTADERAAMKERAKELKAESKRASSAAKAAEAERDLLEKIAEMPAEDRVLAERFHAIVTEVAPELAPKTWYGMPAYNNKDGKPVCFFQSAAKFKSRYATIGFSDHARLDDGDLWPVYYAVAELGEAEAARIAELVKRAVG
ncbi:iron chaperone [Kitasatospora sp. NPDC059795]|uniref:iron chaperone n=1 Tax=Kitasatospora sp. NPDC059795 TaxID=3346949 RepID=UPI0036686565